MILEKVGFKDKDGNIYDVIVKHPATKIAVVTVVVVVIIYAAGKIMPLVKTAILEAKGIQGALRADPPNFNKGT